MLLSLELRDKVLREVTNKKIETTVWDKYKRCIWPINWL